MPERSDQQLGIIAGICSYTLWGMFPLYFHSLQPAGAYEILGHRITWSFLLMIAILGAKRNWSWIGELRGDRRRAGSIVLAGVLLSVNWLVYVWAVGQGRVIDASLGYFINPIVTVVLGVVLLKETIRRWQLGALGLGLVAVVVLTVAYGQLPWIALTLAFTFGSYGYLKKRVGLETIASLTAETALLFPIAAALLVWAGATGRTALGHHGAYLDVKLIGLGVVTAIPLLLFGAATRRIPLVLIGLLQYITPWAQLLIGWLYFDERMPAVRLVGFSLIWFALGILAYDGIRAARESRVRKQEDLPDVASLL